MVFMDKKTLASTQRAWQGRRNTRKWRTKHVDSYSEHERLKFVPSHQQFEVERRAKGQVSWRIVAAQGAPGPSPQHFDDKNRTSPMLKVLWSFATILWTKVWTRVAKKVVRHRHYAGKAVKELIGKILSKTYWTMTKTMPLCSFTCLVVDIAKNCSHTSKDGKLCWLTTLTWNFSPLTARRMKLSRVLWPATQRFISPRHDKRNPEVISDSKGLRRFIASYRFQWCKFQDRSQGSRNVEKKVLSDKNGEKNNETILFYHRYDDIKTYLLKIKIYLIVIKNRTKVKQRL